MLQYARSDNNIAVVTLFRNRYDEAMELFQTARRGFEETHDEHSSAVVLNNIGDLFLRKNEFVSAKQAFEDALSFPNRGGNRHDWAVTRAGLADTLAEMGRLEESLGLYGDCQAESLYAHQTHSASIVKRLAEHAGAVYSVHPER